MMLYARTQNFGNTICHTGHTGGATLPCGVLLGGVPSLVRCMHPQEVTSTTLRSVAPSISPSKLGENPLTFFKYPYHLRQKLLAFTVRMQGVSEFSQGVSEFSQGIFIENEPGFC